MPNRFDYFVEGRAFEWVMAISMLIGGIEIIGWPQLATFGIDPWVLAFVPKYYIGLFMLIVGWIRISGLMLNGQTIVDIRAGPYIRASCAALSASLWVQFALALIIGSIEVGHISIGIPFWIMFTSGELYIAYSVMKNAR